MPWRWLPRWWGRGRSTGITVVLYTRQGCHLCEEAWEHLERARQRHGYTLEVVDVDTDPQLRAQYDTLVPVVTVNGKERFRGRVNPVLLQRLLRAGGD